MRTKPVRRVCESSGIPGVSWGTLLALPGFECLDVGGGRMRFRVAPDAATARLRTARLHPLGKEASFLEGLRGGDTAGGGGGQLGPAATVMRRPPHHRRREWDGSAVLVPGLLSQSPAAAVFRQGLYSRSRDSRVSWTVEPALGISTGWAPTARPPYVGGALSSPLPRTAGGGGGLGLGPGLGLSSRSPIPVSRLASFSGTGDYGAISGCWADGGTGWSREADVGGEGSRLMLTGGSWDLSKQLSAACLQ